MKHTLETFSFQLHTFLVCERDSVWGWNVGTLSELSPCKSSRDSCAQTLITQMDCVFAAVVMAKENQHPYISLVTLSVPCTRQLLSLPLPALRKCVSGWRERDRFAECLWSSEVTLRVFLELSLISQWQLSPVPELNAWVFRNGHRRGRNESRLNSLISQAHTGC